MEACIPVVDNEKHVDSDNESVPVSNKSVVILITINKYIK